MPFLIYTIPWKNFESQDLYIQIQNLDTYEGPGGDTGGGTLVGSGEPDLPPCVLSSIDNDDDKTKPIKSRRLKFGFNSDATHDVETFSDGSDTTFFTALKRGFSDSFHGFISLDDITEAFQPKSNPVQLIASDGLGFLKNQELKTIADELPLGKYTIMDYIVMCLTKTGLDMTINVIMNLFEEDTDPVTEHSWNLVYLDALTFEKDIDEREDCYTVLQKILDAFGCFITQDYEGWWIVRWDEYDAITADRTTLRVARFGADGSFIQYEDVTMDKIIVADYEAEHEGYYLSQDSAQKRFQRKAKEVKHIFKYEYPKEIPCNKELTRGEERAESPGDDTLTEYDPDCWNFFKGIPNVANDGDAFIRATAENNYEDERFFVFAVQPSLAIYYLESQQIPVRANDRLSFSVDIRWDGQIFTIAGSHTVNVAQIRLYADDGTHWTLEPGDPTNVRSYWVQSSADWVNSNRYFVVQFDGEDDDTEYRTAAFADSKREMSPNIPRDGKITILLHQQVKSNEFETHFDNIRFEYFPYIDGSYAKINGQQYAVSQDTDSRVIEKQIYISDSPIQLYKGAMFKEDSSPGDFILAGNWDDHTAPAAVGVERLGKHLVFAWWNQFRKKRTVIDTDVQGIRTDLQGGVPAMQYRYEIHHGGQSAKYFTLNSIHFMDFRNCGWAGVFIENSSGAGDRIYTNDFEFKYLT